MYKTYFFFEPGDDPFAFQGEQALAAMHRCFDDAVGYMQTRALPGQESPAFSGIAEIWFEQRSSALAAANTSIQPLTNETAVVHCVFAGLERVVVRTPGYIGVDRVKGVYPFRRHPDLDIDAFRQYWWHNHGPIAALTEEALSYHQVHPLGVSDDELKTQYDGVTEISWLDAAAAGRAITSRQMSEDQGSDAPNFVDMDSISLILAREEIVLAP